MQIKLKSNFLVMTLLLLLTLQTPLWSGEIEELKAKNVEYAKSIAALQFDNMQITFTSQSKDKIIETKDMIIKEKGEELFWSRVTTIAVLAAVIIGR